MAEQGLPTSQERMPAELKNIKTHEGSKKNAANNGRTPRLQQATKLSTKKMIQQDHVLLSLELAASFGLLTILI